MPSCNTTTYTTTPSISEEEHMNILKQLKTNHLDRYRLQRADSDLFFNNSAPEVPASSVPPNSSMGSPLPVSKLPPKQSPHYNQQRRMSVHTQDFTPPYCSTDTTTYFNNATSIKHKQGCSTTGRRYSVAVPKALQISTPNAYQDDDEVDDMINATVSSSYPQQKQVTMNPLLRRDVVIKNDEIILYGDLKKKKLSDSITWQVPIYEEIIIERITGIGKVYLCDYSNSGKLKLIYDSSSQSVDGILTCNSKFVQLHCNTTYYFKFVKFSPQDLITFAYRNKYSL